MKPILFSTEMVQAILAGKKTQTRRPVKLRYFNTVVEEVRERRDKHLEEVVKDGAFPRLEIKPKYQAGDVLYVRETWQRRSCDDDNYDTECPAGENYLCGIDTVGCIFKGRKYLYKADEESIKDDFDDFKWKPSTNMPKEAARLFLRVTNRRYERLQDISPKDAHAEGIPFRPFNGSYPDFEAWLIKDYRELWESINTKREYDGDEYTTKRTGYNWDENPWVWVYEFERIDKEEAYGISE